MVCNRGSNNQILINYICSRKPEPVSRRMTLPANDVEAKRSVVIVSGLLATIASEIRQNASLPREEQIMDSQGRSHRRRRCRKGHDSNSVV